MPTKLCLFLTVLSGAGVFAQTPAPPAPRTDPPPPAYVRRLSVGVTLRRCERIGRTPRKAGNTACPTWQPNHLAVGGAGGFACQPIHSDLLSVLGLKLAPDRSLGIISESPVSESQYTTTGASQRIGYGVRVQLALTERFAVDASAFLRRIGYKMNSDILAGTGNPNTSDDERASTVTNEDTRARLLDFPLTIRHYGKDRHDSGPRWFIQA